MDLSGVSEMRLSYRIPGDSSTSGAFSFHFVRVSGDARSGTYVGTAEVTPLHHNGTFEMNT